MTAAQERSGVEHDTGKHSTEEREPRPVKEANERVRATSGRFERGQKPESLPAPAPAPLSRQQRRYQARMAQKVARAWTAVTKGEGVTLLDGREVAGDD